MSSETPTPKRADWLTAFDSLLPYSLALVLIVAFLIFIYLIITHQPVDLDLLKTISAVFLGPIGTILGFYFGHRPAEKLENRVQELIDSNRGMLGELEQKKSELERERDESVTEAKRWRNEYQKQTELLSELEHIVKEKEKK